MSNIVVSVMPVWARIETCIALSGVPDKRIKSLCNDGRIRARKMDPERPNSACVYRIQDIFDWLEEDAPKPEKFVIPGAAANGD